MVKKIIPILSLVFFVGCADKLVPPPPKPVEIPTTEIVTVECPKPPTYNKPKLPIEGIDESSSNEEVVRAAAQTILILQGDIDRLKKQLEAYGVDIEELEKELNNNR